MNSGTAHVKAPGASPEAPPAGLYRTSGIQCSLYCGV